MKRSCELCEGTARIHCEPDHASLCWDCDAEVHSANFLVARHSRNLLCHVCQSPTPWSASGSKLGPTAAVCQQCAKGGICEVDEEVAAEEIENHGKPWSPPPPPSSESSSSVSTYEPSDV
ncbi:B-box zinc finger protein 32 [Phtheirospermum japonicum]|uniref:B-box zinc finger protein 32 n=1 Tax=Phtheirospermum japonicum TaxID=374723 RepID=A0A830BRR3_9LAMI|nr:B-box zinc finger protein 32 [Phtheirospermum japonicum]